MKRPTSEWLALQGVVIDQARQGLIMADGRFVDGRVWEAASPRLQYLMVAGITEAGMKNSDCKTGTRVRMCNEGSEWHTGIIAQVRRNGNWASNQPIYWVSCDDGKERLAFAREMEPLETAAAAAAEKKEIPPYPVGRDLDIPQETKP